ncbi:hypothetical protein [Mobilicoccus caccae]|uniref:LPXTG-motif cell wall anchor domain-containing protein n=1 Tax=Mobilicoccus caccae TaxID=1859295 RepID=A0ABQ6ISN7_9MICO|nr:hypothetical protein [Mobilicoccus caccae]GMA40925.1 hypothetical protein GCM10025883_29700 [Mobilicoccus caccae]
MSTSAPTAHTAGIFDIRSIIGLLLAIYGVILVAMGMFADPALEKTGGVNANLIAGIALLVTGGIFLVWVKVRPIVVDETATSEGERRSGH